MASYKTPPEWAIDTPYDIWENEIRVWQMVTDLAKTKQGPAVALTLQGRRRDIALEVRASELSAENGLDRLLAKLKDVFGQETIDQSYEAYESFESLRRDSDVTVLVYIQDFEKLYNRIVRNKMTLPESVLACKLLYGANLEAHERRMVLAAKLYTEGMSQKAIAKKMGLNQSTVCAVIKRAAKKFPMDKRKLAILLNLRDLLSAKSCALSHRAP